MSDVKLTVNGQVIKVDLDKLLRIVDISADMDQVAAHMGYWASVTAAAELEKVSTDSFYRRWKAKESQSLLVADSKLSEWKMRQAIEAHPKFKALKKAIAVAAHNSVLAKGIYEALRTKASMLQSKGAMMRSELDATSMRTPSQPKRKSASNETSEKAADAMRKRNKNKKKVKTG